ncbi:MAG TPA: TadE/TadG family type IV pilus assembly protein [Acidimicrobiia bacterium]|nr:TadE/TadG family type IV pilus assembly protein [Acidimicrobiia bacterium]
MRRKDRHDRGANLVEFAVIAPLLFLLLFGIIEFAWLFASNLDVRQGAREAVRVAATDRLPNPGTPEVDICNGLNLTHRPTTLVSITRAGDNVGDAITVTVDAEAETITGLLDWVIPAGTRLTSTVNLRQEQTPTWAQITNVACP